MKKIKIGSIARIAGVVLGLLGISGIVITRLVFDSAIKAFITAEGEVPMAKENFQLFFVLSLALCAILLGLIFMALAVSLALKQSQKGMSRILIKIYSPFSMIVIIALTVFFTYLSADKLFPIGGYIITLGICEAALFALPMAAESLIASRRTDSKKEK